MQRKKIRCEYTSPLYRKISNSKYNGKVLVNGDIRIGDDVVIDSKTNLLYKLWKKGGKL